MSRIGGNDSNIPRPPSSEEAELHEAREGGGGSNNSGVAGAPGSAPKKVNAVDAERMASQAGFVRSGAKKKGQGFDVGDSSQAPIPLPQDDVDPGDWSMEGLGAAQSQLLQHNARIGRGRHKKRGERLLDMFVALIDTDGEGEPEADAEGNEAERRARLAALVAEVPPSPAAMAALAQSVNAQFGINFSDAPAGAALMATSLLIAGHAEDVQVRDKAQGGGLAPDMLMGGLQRVVEEGRSAADDARRRSEGVSRNIAMHRTFVPKR